MSEEIDAPPEPPSVLGERGSALWVALQADGEFDAKETAVLLEACRTLDRIDALEEAITRDGLTTTGSTGQTVVHPAVAELRQQQAAFGRLIAGLEFEETAKTKDVFRHRRAKAAAAARWERPTEPVEPQVRRMRAVADG